MFNPLEHPVSLREPKRLTQSAWAENVPFGMLLVELLAPKLLIELGTKRGVSYCCFCQAVVELGLPTRCYAVDLWPDDGAEGSYEDFYEELKTYHDTLYGRFSELLKMSFDDALPRYDHGSIDLLHIDGLHSYDAARHDFDTWLPKLSSRGVVLLHDTVVRSEGFGVWRLLEELQQLYPTFNLELGSGLGVVAVVDDAGPLLPFFEMGNDERSRVEDLYRQLGERLVQRQELREQERRLRKAEKTSIELERIRASRSYRAMEPARKAYAQLRRLAS